MNELVRVLGGIVFLCSVHFCWAGEKKERITQSEFECYLKYIHSSVPLQKKWENFVDQKLKAADAKSRGWDTLPSFIQWCRGIQGELLKRDMLAVLSSQLEGACSSLPEYKVEQWFYPLSQYVTKEKEKNVMARMDSLYHFLQTNVKPLRQQDYCHSIGWYTQEMLLDEVWKQVTSLPVGVVSTPFLSPLGVHLVRILKKQNSSQFSDIGDTELLEFSEKNWQKYILTLENRTRLSIIRDSLLAICWEGIYQQNMMKRTVESVELKDYFTRHQSDYAWEFPHFKGAVIHCKNKKEASRIKRLLKKRDFYEWENILSQYISQDSTLQVRMEVGIFQIGKNPYVDKLAFKCGELPRDSAYVFVVGKRLKQYPESYKDVYSEIRKDYQEHLYSRQIQDLKQNFLLEIDPEVLKTVNCCGSN